MTKLVVGVDLSPESERAVAHGVGLARHLGAELVLVLVDDVPDLADVSAIARYRGEIADAHRKELAALRERWIGQGAELSTLVVDGRAEDRLPAIATELGASLVVVGSHGRTGLKRFLVGSVAERVARYADRSVLVTRGDAPDGGYHRVVIGTDFGPQLEASVSRALPLVARGARIDLVHCWQTPWTGDLPLVLPLQELERAYDDSLRAAVNRARELVRHRADLELVPALVAASPVQGLVDAAAGYRADLVVVGSHGRRGVRRLMLGSVAETTLRHAGCSVLVAR